MAGSRQRVVLGLVAALLAVATAGVVVDKFVLQAEWWQEDHRTTTEPAPPLLDVGPPPGPVAVGWRLNTEIRRSGLSPYDQVAHALVDGQLVVATTRGLDVRDARTGTRRWHYHRADWVMLGWAATQRHLVAYLERAGHRDNRVILGFDAASGRLLWRQRDEVPAVTERTTLRWPAGSDVVLTAAADRGVLRGRSVVTGRQVWTHDLPRGCAIPEAGNYASDGGDALAVISLDCGDRSRVLAVDPGTGRTRWSQEFDTPDPPQVAVHGEVTVVSDGTALRAYDRTGKEFATHQGDDVCGATMCPAVVSGGTLIVVYAPGPGDTRRMESIEIATGRAVWRRTVPAYPALVAKGDRLYALRPSLAPNLRPAGIDVIAAGDGRTETVPAPLVVPPAQTRARPWLAAGGGLLYVAVPETLPSPSGAVRLLALRPAAGGPGPAELGGVSAADWPDACALLPARDLPGGHHPRPVYVTVGEVRLPRPVSCTYEPNGDRRRPSGRAQSAGAPTVTMEWVGSSAASTSELLAALRATEPQARPKEIGDEAYELNPSSGTIAVRIGRYLIEVSAYQNPGLATRLARAAALSLHSKS